MQQNQPNGFPNQIGGPQNQQVPYYTQPPQPYQPSYNYDNFQKQVNGYYQPPVYNPVNRQMPPYQQPPYQMQQMPGLTGRTISNPSEIRPNEVAMDGSASFFPVSDGSCIYVKSWGPEGNIMTMKYVPETVGNTETVSEFDQVMKRLDSIERSLHNRKQNFQKQNQKEGGNEE